VKRGAAHRVRSRISRMALSVLLLAPLAGTADAAKPHRNPAAAAPQPQAQRARLLMGTLCTVMAEAVDTTRAGNAVEAAFEEIARLERVMSGWRDDSELSGLNAGAHENRVPVSADLYAALDSALALARDTDGAFDPTVEPLIRAWDLRGEGRVPSAIEARDALATVGWRRVQLEPGARTARYSAPGVSVDLGGIGKGYALDRASDVLRQLGVKRALVNFGGEVLAFTHREPWQVTIADPADRLRPVLRLSLSNGAVSTSAQSERGFTRNGVRYGHVLDPRSGAPVRSDASVSVVSRSATRADALSTALLVMGRENAARYAAAHPGIGVLWLEPSEGVIRAWAWNLAAIHPEPGARVQWMSNP
jgi:thiamine biosynthesis lipoprotein